MTSQINTNGINVNYPVPGTNNSSQGFRDNFSQIRTQLNTGASEISDLQAKVVLKAALNNSTLNNDMANTLISNAATSGFRSTTYNLGNALAGTVLVDVNRADVQFGSVTGNVTLQFGNWSPTNTQSNVMLRLTYANAPSTPAYISLPSNCIDSNNNFGVTLLENYANVNGTATLTAPANTNIVELRFSSIDCGNTVTVEPINRPYKSTEVQTRIVPPTGIPGDVNGAIAVGPSVGQLTISNTIATGNYIISDSTSNLYVTMPIVFTGNTDSSNSNIVAGTTYYVNGVANATAFTISTTTNGSQFDVGSSNVKFYANPTSYLYVCTADFNSRVESKTLVNTYSSGNVLKLNGTANLVVNDPIIFSGNLDTANSNIQANTVYYIKTISSPNVTVSQTRVNGIAGTEIVPGNKSNLNATATIYTGGNDIWKRITLTSW
jgi:hypothetical protein